MGYWPADDIVRWDDMDQKNKDFLVVQRQMMKWDEEYGRDEKQEDDRKKWDSSTWQSTIVLLGDGFDKARRGWKTDDDRREEKNDWRIFDVVVQEPRMNEDRQSARWISSSWESHWFATRDEDEIDLSRELQCWKWKEQQVWEESRDYFHYRKSIEKDRDGEQLTIDQRDIHTSHRSTVEDKNKWSNHSSSTSEHQDPDCTNTETTTARMMPMECSASWQLK
jgi:hypothetical protein